MCHGQQQYAARATAQKLLLRPFLGILQKRNWRWLSHVNPLSTCGCEKFGFKGGFHAIRFSFLSVFWMWEDGFLFEDLFRGRTGSERLLPVAQSHVCIFNSLNSNPSGLHLQMDLRPKDGVYLV